jgi:signal transduction histidine kinase/DNA-binding LacI/PurR family transcriptional regulator
LFEQPPVMTTSGAHHPAPAHRRPDRRKRRRPVIGMLTEELIELWAEQWLGAVDGAAANDCDFICFCGRALEGPGFNRYANAIYDLATAEAVDALVVWTSTLGITVGGQRVEEFCRRFAPLPIVSVEQPLGQAPVVGMDNRQGMHAAVSHLIEVHGRRRIGFVRGPANHDGALERYRGYREALADHGVSGRPEWVSAPLPSWTPDPAAASVARMLAHAEPPDAIAAANDHLALGALAALAAAGVRTPEDVAVAGFDDFMNIRTDDLWFDSGSDQTGDVGRTVTVGTSDSATALPLTTVHAPFHEMGRRSVEIALRLVRGEPVPSIVQVPTALVVRRSCGCFPPAAPGSLAASGVRDRPTIRLRQAVNHRTARLPGDWPERLTTEFEREVRGESTDVFLSLLDRFVQCSLQSHDTAANWSQALLALRQLVDRPTADAAEAARAEDLWQRAQLLVNETVERQWRYAQVLTEKRNKIVRRVGQRLITASDVGALADVLGEQLSRLAIPGCYLAAYESGGAASDTVSGDPAGDAPRDRARLLLAYENGQRVDIPDAPVYDSVQLVPGDRLNRAAPYSMVAAPLYLRQEQLGFVLFEHGPRIGWVYAALREQISTALHRAFMVERERLAYAAVQEAHRREERHRLAGELHDSVSQALFSMTLHTRAMQLAVEQGGDGRARVERGLAELRELTQSALSDMRALIFQLRPDALGDEGLVAAVRRHAATVAARENLDIHVHAAEDRLPLDERTEQEVLRVVQEALHNIVKHARASRVDIRLVDSAEAAGTLVVEIDDDGVGFDPDLPRPGHLGLDSMRERAHRLRGQFTVDSSPAGSTVRAVLPGVLRRAAR